MTDPATDPDDSERWYSAVWQRVLKYLAENAPDLLAWIWPRTDKGQPGILILGPGGVGKTTLAKLLAGEYGEPGKYNESYEVEHYRLSDDERVEIVVPPGQQYRRDATWADLQADLVEGKFRGVILLSAYGHHTFGPFSYKQHKLYKGDKDEFLEAYPQDRRADELSILRQLAPHMRSCRKKLWMLSLVGKQDLWWKQHGAVERHYREGEYAAEIAQLQAHRGIRDFRHEIAFASLVISSLKDGKGEVLWPNIEGYDHQMQTESLKRMFGALAALQEWEVRK